jgi:hypothetical protein
MHEEGDKKSPCIYELSSYFSPEIVTMFKQADKSVPFMHVILEQVCEHKECNHHMFHFWPETSKTTPYSRDHANCMCLINGEAATTDVAAETLGVAHGTIQNTEQHALVKLRRNMKELFNHKEVVSSGKRTHLHRAERGKYRVTV